MSAYRTRTLGGSLLVIKGLNDCATIERDVTSKPVIVKVEGHWTAEELMDAKRLWHYPQANDARRR